MRAGADGLVGVRGRGPAVGRKGVGRQRKLLHKWAMPVIVKKFCSNFGWLKTIFYWLESNFVD